LLIYRAEGQWDDVRVDLNKLKMAWALQPGIYNFQPPNLSGLLRQPSPGKVKVDFLCLIGQSPEKRANTFWIHTQQDQIWIAQSQKRPYGGQQLTGGNVIHWPDMEAGYTFKFQVPQLKNRETQVRSISVIVDGRRGPRLEQIESLENVAQAAFDIKKPLTQLKTISRTVTKGIAAAEAQKVAGKEWGATSGWIAGLFAGAGFSLTENADLRISRFFPAQARIAEMDLLSGMHQIEIEYYGRGNTLLYTDFIGEVEIRADGLNLIESFYLN